MDYFLWVDRAGWLQNRYKLGFLMLFPGMSCSVMALLFDTETSRNQRVRVCWFLGAIEACLALA